MDKALFLDRDGVINKMVAYPSEESFDSPQNIEDVNLNPDIINIVKWANGKNIKVIEITNQPGVAKGKMSQLKADAIERKIHQLLFVNGARVDKVYTCPHHPKGIIPELTKVCNCRKPKPGLLLQASEELGINLEESIFLGDGLSDVEAGKAVGCKTIIFIHENNIPAKVIESKKANADFKVYSLIDTLPIIKNLFRSN